MHIAPPQNVPPVRQRTWHRRAQHAAPLLAVIVLLFATSVASAQEDGRARVYLRYEGKLAAKVEPLSMLFEGPILEVGVVEFAGTKDMDSVYADCRGELGVGATEDRECRLQAARRVFVDEFIEITATKTDSNTAMLTLTVWSPESNAKIFGALVEPEAESFNEGVQLGLGELAGKYLCFRGVVERCPSKGDPVATNGSGDGGKVINIQHNINSPTNGERVVLSESPLSGESRQVTFKPHEDGHWALHYPDNTVACELPCTRWVEVASEVYVRGISEEDSKEVSRILVPDRLGGPKDVPITATPELDSDWQTWEEVTLWLLGAGFVVTILGEVLWLTDFASDNGSTAQTAVGISLFAVGGISMSIVAPIYGAYNWFKEDGKDKLILERPESGRAESQPTMVGLTWTF